MEYIKKMKDWQKFSLKILQYQVSFLVREFPNEENSKIMYIQKKLTIQASNSAIFLG